jgi:hypothetical protein
MRQRGRKSGTALATAGGATFIDRVDRATPPCDLTEDQAQLWRDVISHKPADWFGPDTYPLLAAYCKACADFARISELVDKFDMACLADDDDLKRYDKLTQIQDRLSRAMATLATKMRLTQQAKILPRGAGRADANAAKGRRPWQSD